MLAGNNKYKISSRTRYLIVFSSFIMLIFGVIILSQSFDEFDNATEKGKHEAERLVNILSDQIDLSFLTIDLVLQRATDRQYLNRLFGGTIPEDMVYNFNLWIDETPQIVALAKTNEHGKINIAVHNPDYNDWLNYTSNISQSEPFKTLKSNSDTTISITPHVSKESKHSDLLLVSRRINKLNGGFDGIIIAAVKREYFSNFFASIDGNKSRNMYILLNDGRLLSSNNIYAKRQQISKNILSKFVDTEEKKSGDLTKAITKLEKINGKDQILSFKKSATLPITVIITIDENDYLSNFWNDRIKDILFLLLFTTFGSILSFFILSAAKQIIRVKESEAAAILASQAKSEFLANMSHELRTPLNAIIGFSEMMNSGYFGPMNSKQKERMGDINLCGNHLLQLISDILEFSKGEAGKLEIIEEKVNVSDAIKEIKRMLNEKATAKNIGITIAAEDDLPLLFADKRKVKQILINLINNSIKFTPDNGKIHVSAKIDGTGTMNLIIADTGIGIAAEDISTALAVFGQVRHGKNQEGTGLGLPLCRIFANLHGGKLSLTSTIGEGTTVRVSFPKERVMSGLGIEQLKLSSHESLANFKTET